METFSKREYIELVIEDLRRLGDREIEPFRDFRGICDHFDHVYCNNANIPIVCRIYESLYDLYEYWPDHCGSKEYPVGCGARLASWGDDEEGNLRRDLCHHLADEIEEIIEELI